MGSVGVSFFFLSISLLISPFFGLGVFCHSVLLMDGTYEVKIVRGVENGRRDIHTYFTLHTFCCLISPCLPAHIMVQSICGEREKAVLFY